MRRSSARGSKRAAGTGAGPRPSRAVQSAPIALGGDRDERLAATLGLIPPLTGLVLQFVNPLAALRLGADLRALDVLPPAARREAKLALLRRYVRSEHEQRNWFAHVGPVFLNASVAALQLFVFDQPLMAGIQLVAGIAISELRVWTSPRHDSEQVALHASLAFGHASLTLRFP